jgi:hypothetical protein
MINVEIEAREDDGVIGSKRRHFMFPNKPDTTRLNAPITGGVWIPRDIEIPDKITIILRKEK